MESVFSYDEISILNEDMKTPKKDEFLKKLNELYDNTEDEGLKRIIGSLSVKITFKTIKEVEKIYRQLPLNEDLD